MRIICVMAWVVVAGFGGSGAAGANSVPPAPTTSTVHVGTNGAMTFTPASLTINAGDSVQWVWDGGPHTVTSGAPGAVDGKFCSLPSGTAPSATACNATTYAENAGATFTQTFPSDGTFPYFCEIHGAMMSGTIVVGVGSGSAGGGGTAGGGVGAAGGVGYP